MKIPDGLKAKLSSAHPFRVRERMVQRFITLTGDRNPLHSDREFARRSMYRDKVVHGMLPIGFLSLLDFFHFDNLICSPIEMSSQFIGPVFRSPATRAS